MNLTECEMMNAARIAAAKFFSTDPAIGSDDFESIALLRILERDPYTPATAVHVGREAIFKTLGLASYQNESKTARFGRVPGGEGATKKPARVRQSRSLKNSRKSVKRILEEIGRPEYLFGRYGMVYSEDHWPDHGGGALFDRLEPGGVTGRRKRFLVFGGDLSPAIRRLANLHYVVFVRTTDAPEKHNTELAERCASQIALSAAL